MAAGKFQECIVLYFDIFAYSSKILEKFALSAEEICEYAETLNGIWEEVERIVQKDKNVALYYFSDSCFILYPIEAMEQGAKKKVLKDCVQSAESIYPIFMKKKLFIRGSISCGKVYYSENILFGPSIIRAVRYEGNCPAPMIIMPTNEVKGILSSGDTILSFRPLTDMHTKDNTKVLSIYPILPLEHDEYISMIVKNRETYRSFGDGEKLKYWSDVLEILNKIKR